MAHCRNCGNTSAYHLKTIFIKEGRIDSCNACGLSVSTWFPDVYWPGHSYKSENITDEIGIPILLESKRHKATLMRQQGMTEAGDRVHGMRGSEIPSKKQNGNLREEIRSDIQKAVQHMKRKYQT